MANHHTAQDYTADGPTDVGFRTGGDNTGITNGVVAHITEIGVHGIGDRKAGEGGDQTVGVLGEGEVGVRGKANTGGYGVEGVSLRGSGVGVRGIANDIGVLGESADPDQEGTGVRGLSMTGVGVQGSSGSGPGVNGYSERNVGVNGHGDRGSGIRGSSDGAAYGGVFKSNFAQLRLEPGDEWFGPPSNTPIRLHQIGEFYVDKRGALYYCVGGSPPRWQQLAGPSPYTTFVNAVRNIVKFITGSR